MSGTVEALPRQRRSRSWLALLATILLPAAGAHAEWRSETLHHFTGKPDGELEWGAPLLSPDGALFGTATAGGSYGYIHTKSEVSDGFGTIFKVIPPVKGQTAWTTRVLHSFTGGFDGEFPYGGLISDKDGNLYGITTIGLDGHQGSVFRLAPPAKGSTDWTLTPLHTFSGSGDGSDPMGDLIMDDDGNLYGATYSGGRGCNGSGCGTVFRLAPPRKGESRWTETVLYMFGDGADGGNPEGGLARDAAGVLYGMTSLGGDPNAFAGTVFSLSPPAKGGTVWRYHVLHTFSGKTDGGNPNAAPILDASGALYATTVLGGSFFEGTVFRLRPPKPGRDDWVETVLHNFGEGKDGVVPHGTLVFDKAGALYGTTLAGGSKGLGSVFKLAPPAKGQTTWIETELHAFAGGADGDGPNAAVIFDSHGALYGTTSGSRLEDFGTVFQLTP